MRNERSTRSVLALAALVGALPSMLGTATPLAAQDTHVLRERLQPPEAPSRFAARPIAAPRPGTAAPAPGARASIPNLWSRAALGSLAGTVAGAFVGYQMDPHCCGDDPGLNSTTLSMAALGSVAGASFGAYTTNWDVGAGSADLVPTVAGAVVGILMGGLGAAVTNSLTHDDTAAAIAFPVFQGLTTAVFARTLSPPDDDRGG